jgi:hypothetical protein
VAFSHPSALEGTYVGLLRLSPVVVSTPSGYQLIPSAVGVVRGESEGDKGHEDVGSEQQLTTADKGELDQASANVAATLKALSSSGGVTTIAVEVTNNGNDPVDLKAIGIHGSFTVQGQTCVSGEGKSNSQESSTTSTSTSTTTTSSSNAAAECEMEHGGEVVFVPSGGSVSGTGCTSMTMNLVNGEDHSESGDQSLTLTKGQCVDLIFSGKLSFGGGSWVFVPNTASGQVYEVHVVATEGANLELSCTLPIASTSCSVINHEQN